MSNRLYARRMTSSTAGPPPSQTLDVACALVADTTNGISRVKVERVTLDETLDRLLRATEDHPGVRLVLRSTPTAGEADLVIEQAIAPIHFEWRQPPSWLDRLGLVFPLRQRSRSSGSTASAGSTSAPTDATTTMRELR